MMPAFAELFRWTRHLFAAVFLLASASYAVAADCPVIAPHKPSEAEAAYLHGDYDQASKLYQQALTGSPGNVTLVAGLNRVLLRQQKVKEAGDLVRQALTSNPQSVVLLTELGEVQYREGTPWLAAQTSADALKLDPCYPRAHLLRARVTQLNSLYATTAREIVTAHQLDSSDPQILFAWLNTLPMKQHISELESYLASDHGDGPDAIKEFQGSLERMRQRLSVPQTSCQLASPIKSASIPLVLMMGRGSSAYGIGLDVKLNSWPARMAISTTDSGIVISSTLAERAGLKLLSKMLPDGAGDKGWASHHAFAENIKIGSLEFHNCWVHVVDRASSIDVGVIGLNALNHFLITLDYPGGALLLDPLPPLPGETSQTAQMLQSESAPDETDATSSKTENAATETSPGRYDRYISPDTKDWTPVYRVGSELIVRTTLNEHPPERLFILSVASFTTYLSPELGKEIAKVHTDTAHKVFGPYGQESRVEAADEINFQFARTQQKVQNVPLFAPPKLSSNMGMEIAGSIGATELVQMRVGLDYRDGLVKLVYSPKHK